MQKTLTFCAQIIHSSCVITGNGETLMVALVRSEGLLVDVTGLGTMPCQNGKDYCHFVSDNIYIYQ
jgi:hypothetical protein